MKLRVLVSEVSRVISLNDPIDLFGYLNNIIYGLMAIINLCLWVKVVSFITTEESVRICEIETNTKRQMEECWKGVSDPERVHAGIPRAMSRMPDMSVTHRERLSELMRRASFEDREREHRRKWRDVRKCQDCGASASLLEDKRLRPTRASADDPV